MRGRSAAWIGVTAAVLALMAWAGPVRAGSGPQITSVTPNQITPGSAVVIRLNGENLNPFLVSVDRAQVLGFFRVSATEVIVDLYVPDDAALGASTVRTTASDARCDDCLSIVAGPSACESLNGRNVIAGTDAADTLTGTASADVLCGRGGDDQLNGGAGDDIVLGGPGADAADGGSGADLVFAGSGNDRLPIGDLVGDRSEGEGGDDTFLPQPGGQDFRAAGAPSAIGGDGRDTLLGTGLTGPLIAQVNAGRVVAIEVAFGSAFNDELRAFEEARGGAGHDVLVGHRGRPNVLHGGAGNDDLTGGEYVDELRGGAGVDTLDGASADDLLLGGDDGDTLRGARGADDLRGGSGADTLRGEDGADLLIGQAGEDDLVGGDGRDHLDARDARPTRDARIDGGGDRDRCEIDEEDRGILTRCEVGS